jgi:glyoxylase-like metal-dependent hydrolase (beta-lactamase superfamily II)
MTKLFIAIFLILKMSLTGLAQTSNYAVYALRYATIGHPFPIKYFVLGAPANDNMDVIFMFWLVKGNNKNILVDAGFYNDIEEAKEYDVTNYVRPDTMLAGVGLRAANITDVILTHPHWDHMDGVDLFANAKVWIQREDYNYFVGAQWQKGKPGSAEKRDVRKLVELNLAGKLELVDGDSKEIIPGIKVYTGSRHTFNSQFVLVKSGTKNIILASDNSYTYRNLDSLQSAPKNATFDTSGYINQLKRMKTLASDTKLIIPGHDALLFNRFPMIAEGIIKIN